MSAPYNSRNSPRPGLAPKAFNDALLTISQRGRIGFICPILEIFKDKTRKDVEQIHAFTKPLIQEAIARKKQEANDIYAGAQKPSCVGLVIDIHGGVGMRLERGVGRWKC